MTDSTIDSKIKKKVEDALFILKQLGLPKEQQNERSALTLLALLDLKPDDDWSECSNPLVRGTRTIFSFLKTNYKKKYAENTRETVRKDTIDPFEISGLIVKNSDQPDRPTNSPKTSYQIQSEALNLIKFFQTPQWKSELKNYKKNLSSLQQKYTKSNKTKYITLKIDEKILKLSAGGQNDVMKKVVTHFRQIFSKNGQIIYLGDAEKKWIIEKSPIFLKLGIKIDIHDKMPDVIIYDSKKKWLFLIEAVTSHGPFTEKRKIEMEKIFKNSTCGLIFVTAFPSKSYKNTSTDLRKIDWETEVWFADEPEHLIHYNGHKFLGPY